MRSLRHWLAGSGAAALVCALACGPPQDTLGWGELRQPTGLAVSPDGSVLAVTNGNWDRRAQTGTLVLLDLIALDAALANPGSPNSDRPCRAPASDGSALVCTAAEFIDAERTVALGDGVGNIAIDRPAGEDGPARLLIPTSAPAAVVWLDLQGAGSAAAVDCGQNDDGRCDQGHTIRQDPGATAALPDDPARISVASAGARFAYVPHLLGGSISLLALDGEAGPHLTDVLGDFFQLDPFDEELAGGFAVAQRPCDPLAAPRASRDCTRPLLYATHRYFPGMRELTVAPGRNLLLPGREIPLPRLNVSAVRGRPFMADLAFEDEAGEVLLVVATTPAALLRVRSTVSDTGALSEEILGTVPLCANPNALALYQPAGPAGAAEGGGSESLALVACRGAATVSVIGLSSFRVLRSVAVGEGPSEVLVDPARAVAFVANTGDDSVSIIGLDPRRADFLAERARLGPGSSP